MRPALALLVVLLPLSGCTFKADIAGTAWNRPGMTIQDVTLHEMECARLAREAGFTPDLIVGGLADVGRLVVEERQRQAAYQQCMQEQGYQPAGSS
jgi:hypothetical protein